MKYNKFWILGGVLSLHLFISCDTKKPKLVPLTHKWEKTIPHQEIPKGLLSLSSESCGECHQDHYKEWKTSTHAHAWSDLQFQAEIKKESSPFMCINCHIPLQNQQEYIVEGLIDGDIYKPKKIKNPNFDRALQKEGINCASCHVRDGIILGVNGITDAPHAVKKDPMFLSEKLCISCHQADFRMSEELVCTFQTGGEWEDGPYFGEKNCISCHMDTIQRPMVKGFNVQKNHLHYFPGSGIPKLKGLEVHGLQGLVFYPSKVNTIYRVADVLNFEFKVVNENAGHRVPTGDPERFYIFKFELRNKEGELIDSKEERIGEKWEWYPKAVKLSDNNLNPLEERIFTFYNKLIVKGEYKLSVNIAKHRMDKASVAYNKLEDNYPLMIKIYEKSFSFKVE